MDIIAVDRLLKAPKPPKVGEDVSSTVKRNKLSHI